MKKLVAELLGSLPPVEGVSNQGSVRSWTKARGSGANPRLSFKRSAEKTSRAVLDSWWRLRDGRYRARRPADEAIRQENRLHGSIGRLPFGAGTSLSRSGLGLLCGIEVAVCPC